MRVAVDTERESTRRTLGRLTRRPEFLAVAATRKRSAQPGVIVQVRRHDPPAGETAAGSDQIANAASPTVRYGLTASRKVGNAVARNRAKRRLRALAEELLPETVATPCDIVMVARTETVTRPFALLRNDVNRALRRLGLAGTDKPRPTPSDEVL